MAFNDQSSQPRSPLSAPPRIAEPHSDKALQMHAKFAEFSVSSLSKTS